VLGKLILVGFILVVLLVVGAGLVGVLLWHMSGEQFKRWLWNLFVSLDQLLNTILFGDPDETLSSRCAKHRDRWPWSWLAWLLETIRPGHLQRALERDEGARAIWPDNSKGEEDQENAS